MNKDISREQGDINVSVYRENYQQGLAEESLYWIDEDADVFLHQALSTPVMNVLSRTEGAYIYDLQGKSYLDLHGNGVHNAGFSNPAVIRAVIAQLESKLAFTPRRYTNIPAVQLAKKLVEIAPESLTRVLFCPGGSEAIEMAITLAKQVTGRWKTISYWDAFHGAGFQAASVGGEEHFSGGNGPMVPGAFHVEFPNYYRNPWGLSDQDQIDRLYLRQIEVIVARNPDISAIIAEPISATPVVPSANYWRRVREICDEHGIFLIFDEVIEGLGRTGNWFASQKFVEPDVLVLGKSLGGGLLPFAGIMTREKHNIVQHRSIGHYTHEKNPLCAVAGLATIHYLEEHNLVQHARIMGQYLIAGCLKLQARFAVIGHVAGEGLHIGLDLVKDLVSKEPATAYAERFMYACLEKGISFKIINGNVVTIRPALTISQEQCDEILRVFEDVFEQLGVA